MKPKITTKRISGISYKRPTFGRSGNYWKQIIRKPIALQLEEIQQAGPPFLSKQYIAHLIMDLGRNELHTLISDCVEHCTHWQEILFVYKKFLADNFDKRKELKHEFQAEDSEEKNNTSEAEIALEVYKIYRQWRHYLTILEMISDSQFLAEYEKQLKISKYKNR